MKLDGAPVTVLGAGVAGLALARALALRGAQVTLMEQAEAIREVGAGLQISPNGAAVLRALGLGEALDAGSIRATGVRLINGPDGAPVTGIDLTRGRGSYHLMHRADLIDLLAEGARSAGVEIRLLQRIETVDLSGARPRIVTAQGVEHAPAVLIGADGLHSRVHHALNGVTAPFFTNQVAWRAVIPCEPGADPVAEVHMAPGKHLVSYPLRGGTLRNIVAVEERRRWVEEGWNLKDDPMSLRVAFEAFNPRVKGWLAEVQECWLWGLFRHNVARTWQKAMPEGVAAILGDAAHPTLPFLAQGANMALEDAWVLAATLDRDGITPGALSAYQAARAPRCARIVEAANANARAYHLGGPVRAVAHLGLRALGAIRPDFALARYDWIYGHDVTAA
ncbi:monooxygenase [Aliigemmobacter aestuarii]|uniref:Monooxygenase n=1 Tax=Aliigemmobacter aestuarii TaxID=1445661 RepID=A0A4S3MR37_9RHOB|nr:FAD-dependent monooxygenase [Gemmobacter aestuarii]THD84255.1 monooxygenase [Gemmobacter aestuarii]